MPGDTSQLGPEIIEGLEADSGLTPVEKLKVIEQRMNIVLNAVDAYAIFLLAPDGTIVSWNDSAKKIMGYEAHEVVGRHFSLFYPEDLRKAGSPDHRLKIARDTGRYEEEGLRVRKDGTEFWVNASISSLRDGDGKVEGFIKITRDVTERKIAENKLRESEERWRLLLESVQDYAIFMLDPEGKVSSWNTGAQRIIGYESAEIIGKSFEMFYPEEALRKGHPQYELKVARQQGRYEEEGIRVRKNGSTFWSHVIITALHDEEGTLRGFAKVTRDITERKKGEQQLLKAHEELERRVLERTQELTATVQQLQAEITQRKRIERELIRAKEEADEANKSKSAFLANMSHEIRTPLGAILGFSDLLVQQSKDNQNVKKFGEAITRNGRLLVNIINDILDLSKVEAGKIEINKSDFELGEFLNEVGALLGLQASEKGLEFDISAQGRIPKVIYSDALRLKQILFNIVGNAIKFTAKGRVSILVREIYEGVSSKLAFIVTDTGVGISADGAKKLFQPFSQADASTTRRFGGTGLGLILSRKLAEQLGGDVVLTDSSLDKGSTFTVTVDTGNTQTILFQNQIKKPIEEEPKDIFSLCGLENQNILVVEDVFDNQNLIRFYLETAGARVEIAENGLDGLNKAMQRKYDLILMDLQMPIMDGYEATAELRKKGLKTPIIALSAHAMEEEKKRCFALGFNDHISKPIDPALLIKSLSKRSHNIN